MPTDYIKLKEYFDALLITEHTHVNSVREILEAKIQALNDLNEVIRTDSQRGILAASTSMNSRLDSMNEFRSTIDDYVKGLVSKTEFQAFTTQSAEDRKSIRNEIGRFMTRSELESFKNLVESDIESLKISRATLEGKASQQSMMIALIISFVSILIGGCGFILSAISIAMRIFGY